MALPAAAPRRPTSRDAAARRASAFTALAHAQQGSAALLPRRRQRNGPGRPIAPARLSSTAGKPREPAPSPEACAHRAPATCVIAPVDEAPGKRAAATAPPLADRRRCPWRRSGGWPQTRTHHTESCREWVEAGKDTGEGAGVTPPSGASLKVVHPERHRCPTLCLFRGT